MTAERSQYYLTVHYEFLIPSYSDITNTTDRAEKYIHPFLPSLLSIVLRARLGRQFQRLRRILLGHEQLHELEFPCRRELLIVEEIFSFLFRFHLVGFRVLGRAAKCGNEVGVFPLGDVVVGCFEAVDVAFDGVAFVVDEEAGVSLAWDRIQDIDLGCRYGAQM